MEHMGENLEESVDYEDPLEKEKFEMSKLDKTFDERTSECCTFVNLEAVGDQDLQAKMGIEGTGGDGSTEKRQTNQLLMQ